MNACEAGYRVKFYTAVNLAAELAEAVQMNKLSKLEKSLSKIVLLIIDELSYLRGCGHILGLFYADNPRLCLYSTGLI